MPVNIHMQDKLNTKYPDKNVKRRLAMQSVFVVHLTGVEPAPPQEDTDLNRARLPIPPQVHIWNCFSCVLATDYKSYYIIT